jgi:glycosyltransferase involved in cell wall biosynthesis
MQAPPLLTVIIPTYGRPQQIAERVREILPQLGPDLKFVIYDNCSPVPVAEAIADVAGRDPEQISIVRHPRNLGAVANIIRCIEQAETEWVWLLGDDDQVRPDAVARVLGLIKRWDHQADLCWINLSTSLHQYAQEQFYQDTEAFCRGCEETPTMFSNTLFISGSVCRAPLWQRQLAVGYRYLYACSSTLPVLLGAMNAGGKVLVSSELVIDWQAPEATGWNRVEFCHGVVALAELDFDKKRGYHLARAGLRCHSWRHLFLTGVYVLLMDRSRPMHYWRALFAKYVLYQRGGRKFSAIMLGLTARVVSGLPFLRWSAQRVLPDKMGMIMRAQQS